MSTSLLFAWATGAGASDELTVPEEAELLRALREAYRDPKITTTKAMHQVRHTVAKATQTGAKLCAGTADMSPVPAC